MKLQHTCAIVILVILASFVYKAYGQESLFPQIQGWDISQDTVVYNANNLWDIIDGAADLFLEYNFVSLHIARYSKSDTLDIKVELYLHRSAEDAFGMYSQERDTGYNFIPLGVQGYLEKGALNFCAGRYYVKISTNQSGQSVQNALMITGTSIEKHLRQPNTAPEMIRLLPTQGRLANTEQYVAKNFMGYGFFRSAFTAMYRDSIPFKIFIMKFEISEQAKKALDEYLKTMPNGAVDASSGMQYRIRDPHHGLTEFLLVDKYLCGILNCSNADARTRYLGELKSVLLH